MGSLDTLHWAKVQMNTTLYELIRHARLIEVEGSNNRQAASTEVGGSNRHNIIVIRAL